MKFYTSAWQFLTLTESLKTMAYDPSWESCIGGGELRRGNLYIAAFGEFWGTAFLVFIGCGTTLGKGASWSDAADPSIVQISFAFGFIIASMVWCLGHISGGHINPAVTLAFFFARRISFTRTLFYIAAQILGAIFGSGFLAALTNRRSWMTLGQTSLDESLTQAQGFGIEFMTTYAFIWTIFACCDPKRDDMHGSAPLTIGICATCLHLFSIKYTGTGFNPARSFGPDVILSIWPVPKNVAGCPIEIGCVPACTEDCKYDPWVSHWIYWVGPIAGAITAGCLYEYIYAANASPTRFVKLVSACPYVEADSVDDANRRRHSLTNSK